MAIANQASIPGTEKTAVEKTIQFAKLLGPVVEISVVNTKLSDLVEIMKGSDPAELRTFSAACKVAATKIRVIANVVNEELLQRR